MGTTLITFLGRTPKDNDGYRKTKYIFPDQKQTDPVAFFGWVLRQRYQPQRMIVLGTTGSMWEHLFEGDIELGDAGADERLALISACEHKQVTQPQLDSLSPYLTRQLGCEVRLCLIPYARDEAEQVDLLKIISEQVPVGEVVQIDVTHGFRHLPMLSLLAALYLRMTRKAQIEHIWYGAFDPDAGVAPVYDLTGLLRIADGLQSLSSFDKDGDYGVFLPLLQKSGLDADIAQRLREAAYFENILNVGEATGKLRQAMDGLKQAVLEPDAQLFLPLITERISWLEEDRQFQKLTHLAERALERKDYLRSILYAYEAVITRLCQRENRPITSFEDREEARRQYEAGLNQGSEEKNDYALLKNLRNQVAHGTRGQTAEVQRNLLSEEKMRNTLRVLLDKIRKYQLPAELPKPTVPALED